METLLLKNTPEDIEKAGELLRGGGLVALPTETVYGLGANALDAAAVANIFGVKGRPADNPLIVHIADMADLGPDIALPDLRAYKLAEAFWPGPLTLVMPKGKALPDITTGGHSSVGIRIPAHPAARAVIKAAGLPIAAPSANRSGRPSPTSARHCIEDLWGRVEAILDGGDCEVGIESTVLSLLHDTPEILRPGAVTADDIAKVLGTAIAISPGVLSPLENGAEVHSPGVKYRHYAPAVPLFLALGDIDEFAGFINALPPGSGALVFEGEQSALRVPSVTYGKAESPQSQAERLFDALRQLDGLGVSRVYARAPDRSGLGLGIYNRLLRAASFEVIDLAENKGGGADGPDRLGQDPCVRAAAPSRYLRD